eukprot:1595564-Alexandrium_andersonii.AAC.1
MVVTCGRGSSVQGQTNGLDAPTRQARPRALQEEAADNGAVAHPGVARTPNAAVEVNGGNTSARRAARATRRNTRGQARSGALTRGSETAGGAASETVVGTVTEEHRSCVAAIER